MCPDVVLVLLGSDNVKVTVDVPQVDDWNGGTINRLIDVIVPTKKATGSVVANFRSVAKEGDLRSHPVVGQLLDAVMLEKLDMKATVS